MPFKNCVRFIWLYRLFDGVQERKIRRPLQDREQRPMNDQFPNVQWSLGVGNEVQ